MENKTVKDSARVVIFKAPEGDYRQIVLDHMLKMANYEWTPKESFDIKWKGESRFKVDLHFEKGETYHGITYSNTKGCFDIFEDCCENGEFVNNSEYYEEIIGNHCSSSMAMAYQQLIDFPFQGTFKPSPRRAFASKLVGNLRIPTQFGTKWDALDVLTENSKKDVMEAYAQVDAGDMIFFCTKRKSGHIRMVYSKSDVVRDEHGEIDPSNSFVHCIEQTNSWDKTDAANGKKTTWWIDHKYSFARLYEKEFMPVTLQIFSSEQPLRDAFVVYDGNNDAQSIKNGLNGTVSSNFPLNYARVNVRNADGQIVRRAIKYDLAEAYTIDLAELNDQLDINSLPSGKYDVSIRAAIARGGHTFESFTFEK